MIYCVRFSEVVEYLNSIGFRQVGTVEGQVIFRGSNNKLAIIREPNVHGNLPENIVNDAFYTARLEPPDWDVFWGD
ncbi:MAG: hypothetical protein QOC72_3124 [Methylobacteriaceae bacterium]|nr:hypothetical protein [Methylobacteriaceae bacterium]